jgi:voltage-gated potassium channel
MIMTTMGSEYWPQTPEGRVLTVFLALYAFAVFGYVTATLARFLIGRDMEQGSAVRISDSEVAALIGELSRLRATVEEGKRSPAS